MDVGSVGLSKTAVLLIRLGGGVGLCFYIVGWEVSVPGHRLIGRGTRSGSGGKNIQLRFGSQLSALGQSNGKRQRQKLAGRGIGSPTVARSGGLRMAHPAGLGGLRRMSNGKSNDNGEMQGFSTPLRLVEMTAFGWSGGRGKSNSKSKNKYGVLRCAQNDKVWRWLEENEERQRRIRGFAVLRTTKMIVSENR